MKYLGLMFHAPIQSWGGVSLPEPNSDAPRNTENIPTKSALLGMLRSALGITRGGADDLGLTDLRVLIREDRPGRIRKDYQVAQRTHHGYKAGSTKEIPKYHLQDATFTVLLGHPDTQVLETIHDALKHPQWALFLGRRAHVPALPVLLGSMEASDPRSVLADIPLLWGNSCETERRVRLYDSDYQDGEKVVTQTNEPLTYDMKRKQYTTNRLGFINIEHARDEKSTSTLEQYLSIKDHFQG